jgi:hypothetical protein
MDAIGEALPQGAEPAGSLASGRGLPFAATAKTLSFAAAHAGFPDTFPRGNENPVKSTARTSKTYFQT